MTPMDDPDVFYPPSYTTCLNGLLGALHSQPSLTVVGFRSRAPNRQSVTRLGAKSLSSKVRESSLDAIASLRRRTLLLYNGKGLHSTLLR